MHQHHATCFKTNSFWKRHLGNIHPSFNYLHHSQCLNHKSVSMCIHILLLMPKLPLKHSLNPHIWSQRVLPIARSKKMHISSSFACIMNTTYATCAVFFCQAFEENKRQAERASLHRRWPSENISTNVPVGWRQPVDVIPTCAREAVAATSIIWSASPLLHRLTLTVLTNIPAGR